MRKTTLIYLSTFLLAGLLLVQSCKKDDDDDEPQEFVADNSTFSGFMSWSLDVTRLGADPALGGMAHGGDDTTVTRNIYFKDGQNPVSGKYPVGTRIVKRSTNPGGLDEITAMVKRGGNFDSGHGDWEYFMLMPDGSIAMDNGVPMRGANLMNGMCKGCHGAAASKDYIFTK